MPTHRTTRTRPRLLALAVMLAVLTTACNVRSVGINFAGQLGDGSQVDRGTPVTAGVVTFAQVSAGSTHSCGVSDAGALHCWGDGTTFRLGLGDLALRLEPTRVGTGSGWTDVSAGGGHTCGIEDGRILCWGQNFHGQAIPHDPRTTIQTPTPLMDQRGDRATTISAGSAHSCATFASGILACWGRNNDGRLGTGDTSDDPAVRVVGDGFTSVSADSHSCAITTTRELRCWGTNGQGQLGVGDLVRRLTPTAVTQQPGWASVEVGSNHTCARAADQTAWCWGENEHGQLGTGSVQDRVVPARVLPGVRWIALAAGAKHSCGVRADQRVLCWGDNDDHQLGDGTTTTRLVPTAMAGDIAGLDVSAGHRHTHVVVAAE